MNSDAPVHLDIVLGNYPHTLPLKRGDIASSHLALDFVDIKPTNRAFKPMVREQRFDVSELAIVTYLQAKAFGKPLVLIPATMLGRFQHGCMLYNAERRKLTPKDIEGRKVGVRAYTQTTGAWLRGILGDEYGVDLDRVQWVTFEDAHVLEYHDPAGVERAQSTKDLTTMLLDGDIDAAIYGADLPDDPRLKSVIPAPDAAAQFWYQKHRIVPINHMVVVKSELSSSSPDVVRELFRLLGKAKAAAGLPSPEGPDPIPFGIEATRPALELIIEYALKQRLISRRFTVDELFDDTTRALHL